MSRNSSGVYSLPLPAVVPGTLVTAAWANTTLNDIAQALTDSLDRLGRGGMNAPLRVAGGTAASPGFSFTGATQTGVYSTSSGLLEFTVLGVKKAEFNAAGMSIIGALTATGLITMAAGLVAHPTGQSQFTLKPVTSAQPDFLVLDTADAVPASRSILWRTNGLTRWQINVSSAAESGANAGSDFSIARYDDAGMIIGTAMSINRATGAVTFSGAPSLGMPDGLVSAPGLGFTLDTNTGLYRPGADILGVSAGGVESARFHNAGLSIKSGIVTATLVVDRLAGTSTAPALTAGTVAALLGNATAGSPAYLTLVSGNATFAGVNFGDTDADSRGFIRYDHSTEIMQQFAAGNRFQFRYNGTAATVVAQAMGGVELLSGSALNTTNKYTNALKFGSVDSDFTTTNPKFGAGLVGYATETYSADTSGGMGMEFFTQPNAPGAAGNLLTAGKINNSQRWVIGNDDDNYAVLGFSTIPKLGVSSVTAGDGLGMAVWNSVTRGTRILGQTSAGAGVGTHALVSNGDNLLQIVAAGSDGTQFVRAAEIRMQVDGAPGANDMPGRILFMTTPDAASAPTEAMRIASTNQMTNAAATSTAIPGHLINMIALGIGTEWNDGTRNAQMRAVAAGMQFGCDSNHSLAIITNNAIRATMSAAGTFSYKTVAGTVDTTELAPTSHVHANAVGGQTTAWVNAGRAFNTNFTNTFGHPIQVLVSAAYSANGQSLSILSDGVIVQQISNGTTGALGAAVGAIIPVGAVYRVNATAGMALNNWMELR